MMKEFISYASGETCGLVFKAKYIDRRDLGSSDLQELGQWFEYITTGAKARGGKIPAAPTLKTGALPVAYHRMQIHSKRFDKILKKHGLKIAPKGIGVTMSNDISEGTYDLLCVATRDIVIGSDFNKIIIPEGAHVMVDIKTSGLLEDKWNDLGWETESLPYKEKIMAQVVHYKWLYKELNKIEPYFMFLVFSNTNEYDSKMILVEVDPDKLSGYREKVSAAKRMIENENSNGFKARPKISNCKNCKLGEEGCKLFTDLPEIEVVYYG